MPWEPPQTSSVDAPARSSYNLSARQPGVAETQPFAFGINSLKPPPTDSPRIMQRADEVNTIQRMLTDERTSAVMIVGASGAGKSTLAALLFQRLKLSQYAGMPGPRYLVWLEIGTYTTIPDMIAAILQAMGMKEPGLHLLKPEQQINLLLQALRRPLANALVVLDQFEVLLHAETNQGVAGRGVLSLFLALLQTDLGASRILLTGYSSPFERQNTNMENVETRVRSYLVSRISTPEGVALLQHRGVQGSPEELSLIWQRCAGDLFSLVLFSTLGNISGISLSYLLNASDYQPMWRGEVAFNLITAVFHFLNPIQYALMRALSLFHEPVPFSGIMMTSTGNKPSASSQQKNRFERELHNLTRLSLVQQTENWFGTSCYMLHPLLCQYMLEYYLDISDHNSQEVAAVGASVPPSPILPQPQELQAALAAGHLRVAHYYQSVAHEQCPSHEQRQRLQDIQPIISALRHLCLGGRWQQACEMLFEERLHESMVQWGAWNALLGLYTALLPPFGVLLRRDEGMIASLVGMLYGRMGEQQQSRTYFEQALTIQRQIDDAQGEATTLVNQGELLRTYGNYEQAHKNLAQALTLSEQCSDPALKCVLLHNLGLLYHAEKKYQEALTSYTEALKLARGLREPQNKGMILTNLGLLMYEQGAPKEALALLLAALQIRLAQQDPTVPLLQHFLEMLERKVGTQTYMQMCQEALGLQQRVLARFDATKMSQ